MDSPEPSLLARIETMLLALPAGATRDSPGSGRTPADFCIDQARCILDLRAAIVSISSRIESIRADAAAAEDATAAVGMDSSAAA